MSPIHVLDDYYLAITFLISLAIQSTAFLVSYTLQFDKITDFSGGFNFFVLALITLVCGQTFEARNLLVSLGVMVWAVRLGGFLLFRVLKRGKDGRFDGMRGSFVRFGAFWTFQLAWVWLVSLPVSLLNSPNISSLAPSRNSFGSPRDIAGILAFAIGISLESAADVQKFRSKSAPSSAHALPVCTSGVWKWSRHPNYFGEILLWWGIWLMAIDGASNAGVGGAAKRVMSASVISPMFVTVLLLFLSGLPTAERPVQRAVFVRAFEAKLDKTASAAAPDGWAALQAYLDSTSILLPLPPALYRRIPKPIARSLLLDWPLYRFDPDSAEARALVQDLAQSHS